MDQVSQEIKDVENRIVDTLIGSLDKEMIETTEVPHVASYVLDNLYGVTTHDELMQFLRDVSAKWPIFTNLLVVKYGQINQAEENKAASNVLQLAKSGKIEEAVDLAKQAMSSSAEDVAKVAANDVPSASEPVVSQTSVTTPSVPAVTQESQSVSSAPQIPSVPTAPAPVETQPSIQPPTPSSPATTPVNSPAPASTVAVASLTEVKPPVPSQGGVV